MKIEIADINSIKPYENNPRKLSDKAIETVAMSLKEYGFRQPIVVDKDRIIVVGHTRFRASKKLGFKEVPITIADNLTPEQINAYRIADNRTSEESEWDNELLKMEIKDLEAKDFKLDLLGFNEDQLNDILFEEKQGLTDEDEVPEAPEEPISKLGDIWKLGNHRLLCGDSTNKDNYDNLINEDLTITFTSPPYNVSTPIGGNKNLKKSKYINSKDNIENFNDLLINSVNESLNKSQYVFYNIQQLANNKIDVLKFLYKFKNEFVDTIIWDKQHTAPAIAPNVLNSRFEYIFIFSNKNNKRSINTGNFRGTLDNVYNAPPQRSNKFSHLHAATFPIHLPTFIISNFTKKKDSVLDNFSGTGTTLIACEKLDRVCYGIELDPKYCDVIVKRWEDFTGKKAELENGQN
jgi:DNA modification methylase